MRQIILIIKDNKKKIEKIKDRKIEADRKVRQTRKKHEMKKKQKKKKWEERHA